MKFCIYILAISLICVGITSCGTNKTNVGIQENYEPVSDNNIDIENELDSIDYTLYFNKTWVVDNWDGGAYEYPFSFRFTKIENNVIEGKFSAGSVAMPDFFSYDLEPWPYIGDISGTIHNGVGECQFSDKVGNSGIVTFVFGDGNEIEATIEFTIKKYIYENENLDGKYIFRPFNFSDLRGVNPDKKSSFEVDLNSWGTVNFVTVVFTGNKPTPDAYLTNEYDEILYHFGAPYQVDTEIMDVVIEDINGDGLKDVKMTTNYEEVEWTFYQMDNGLFYDSKLDKN